MASGLAAGGTLPIVHSFATFLSGRPMEQAVNAGSERRKVAYVAALAGLLPASPGHSHQGTQDVGAFTRAGATVVAPSSERSVVGAVRFLLDHTGPVYLRLCSLAAPLPFEPPDLPRFGTGATVHTAAGAARTVVLAYGPVLLGEAFRAVAAAPDLADSVTLIDLPWLNAVDPGWLASAIGAASRLVVLDDHDIRSGLGSHVGTITAGLGSRARLEVVGVAGLPECGAPAEVLAHHGLDAASLATRLRTVG